MKYSSEMDLLIVVFLGLMGLLFLWLLIPVPVGIFNYLPLFLISYLLVIILPGYAFLTFIKPDMAFLTRILMGVVASSVMVLLATFLFLFLEIPLAFTYAVSVILILGIIMALMTYLADKMEGRKRSPPTKRKSAWKVEEKATEQDKEEKEEKTPKPDEGKIKHPPRRRTRLTPPREEVEVIIPNHVPPPKKIPWDKNPGKNITSSEKPALKLPWIERQKELDQEKNS